MADIPDQLVELAAQRRLIPFVGAGFSAGLGFPSWRDLLRTLCDESQHAVTFDEVIEATNGDLLQAAEYLYLKHDRQIGPLRHEIERSFAKASVDPLTSGPHVELVNLGAGQIYTTNYDDAIERTYTGLGLSISPVVLPKDVALADTDKTQIVKYHGDLAHERTLVLTESAYYRRLDFESPMDLKFRSDLLGKSVLFMGYSFRDINIRIIWFKLMEMMRDIPEADRHPSYIVMLEPNAVLEDLYAAVGLHAIVLSPDAKLETEEDRVRAVGSFLFDLSIRASTHPRARSAAAAGSHSYVSSTCLDSVESTLERLHTLNGVRVRQSVRLSARGYGPFSSPSFNRLREGTVPPPLRNRWKKTVLRALEYLPFSRETIELIDELGPSTELTSFVVEMFATNGDEEVRAIKEEFALREDVWRKVWSRKISVAQAKDMLKMFRDEIYFQAQEGADNDIAYLAELATRIANGSLLKAGEGDEVRSRATSLLHEAAKIYPSISELRPTDARGPDVSAVVAEVSARERAFERVPIDIEMVMTEDEGPHR